jgi:hypothetical protein
MFILYVNISRKLLKDSNMHDANLCVPLIGHFMISNNNRSQCPKNEEENDEMSKVPYSPVMSSLK